MMTREDLMKKTVKELREMAKKNRVQGYSKLSKSELVACLEAVKDFQSDVEIKEEVTEMEEVKETAVSSEEEVVLMISGIAMRVK